MRTVPWDSLGQPAPGDLTRCYPTACPSRNGFGSAATPAWGSGMSQCPGCRLGAVGQLLSSAPSPAPLPACPTSKRAMFLPSYSLPFSRSVLLMKGLLSLGLPSPVETPLSQSSTPCPTHTWRTPTPQGHHREGSQLPVARGSSRSAARAVDTMLAPSPSTGDGRLASQPPASPPTPHTGRGCHPQEPHAALPGRADTWTRRSASTQ